MVQFICRSPNECELKCKLNIPLNFLQIVLLNFSNEDVLSIFGGIVPGIEEEGIEYQTGRFTSL